MYISIHHVCAVTGMHAKSQACYCSATITAGTKAAADGQINFLINVKNTFCLTSGYQCAKKYVGLDRENNGCKTHVTCCQESNSKMAPMQQHYAISETKAGRPSTLWKADRGKIYARQEMLTCHHKSFRDILLKLITCDKFRTTHLSN